MEGASSYYSGDEESSRSSKEEFKLSLSSKADLAEDWLSLDPPEKPPIFERLSLSLPVKEPALFFSVDATYEFLYIKVFDSGFFVSRRRFMLPFHRLRPQGNIGVRDI